MTLISILVALGLYGARLGSDDYWGGSKTELDLLIESSMYTRVATALVAVATAPLVEEVIYRGVIYPAVEKVTGPVSRLRRVAAICGRSRLAVQK